MSKPLPEMSLSSKEREELYRVIRKSTSPQHWVLRARIVLLAEKRLSTEAIMKELNTSRNTVVKRRKRFCKSRLDGLKDEQRPGKPRTHDAAVRLKIAADACRPPETITHWSTRELAQHLYEQGKIIKRGVFSSKEDLAAKTLEFIELYNKKAKPFRWTYTGDPLTI